MSRVGLVNLQWNGTEGKVIGGMDEVKEWMNKAGTEAQERKKNLYS